MHDTENDQMTRNAASRWLQGDFARVNPNTGTAPVFRTRRDAEITRGIYERHPVLVEHSGRMGLNAGRGQCGSSRDYST